MAEAPGAHWTRTRDIRDTVRRWWRRGDIARAVLPPVLSQVQLPELQIPGTPCVVSATSGADTPVSDDESTVALAFPRRMPLRAPGTGEIANVFDAVRDWVREIDALDVRCRIEHREIRHRQLGRNRLPCAVWFDTPEQAARFIGESTALETVRSRGAELLAHDVRLGPWLQRRPLQLTALEDRFARMLVVHAWMRERPRPGCYLREIDVPGVDSKFIETHRELLAAWLDATLPPTAIDDRYRGISGFARRYGFRERVPRIRLRSLDPERPLLATCAGLPLTTADLTLDAISAAALAPPHRQALIVENEINYLALPDLPDTIALFGAGYGHEAIAELDWLEHLDLIYWGDIDTHGFAILDALRARWPAARSILMDRETLLEHRELWGREPSPTRATLAQLDDDEQSLFAALCEDVYGPQLRLEQERIGQGWVLSALRKRCCDSG